MIAFLRGTVEDMTESSLVLDVHGVGYEVLVPDVYKRQLLVREVTTGSVPCSDRAVSTARESFRNPRTRNMHAGCGACISSRIWSSARLMAVLV